MQGAVKAVSVVSTVVWSAFGAALTASICKDLYTGYKSWKEKKAADEAFVAKKQDEVAEVVKDMAEKKVAEKKAATKAKAANV